MKRCALLRTRCGRRPPDTTSGGRADRVQRFQGDLPGDRDGHVRPGHGPGGHGEDRGLQRVQEGEGGDNEGHRERGGGGLTRRRRGWAHPFIVSDLLNRV